MYTEVCECVCMLDGDRKRNGTTFTLLVYLFSVYNYIELDSVPRSGGGGLCWLGSRQYFNMRVCGGGVLNWRGVRARLYY